MRIVYYGEQVEVYTWMPGDEDWTKGSFPYPRLSVFEWLAKVADGILDGIKSGFRRQSRIGL